MKGFLIGVLACIYAAEITYGLLHYRVIVWHGFRH